MFESTSRYFDLQDLFRVESDGRRIVYKERRFLPQGATLPILGEAEVQQADRLDLIAYRAYEDALLYWRVCDANNAMDPFDLTAVPGRRLRIPSLDGL